MIREAKFLNQIGKTIPQTIVNIALQEKDYMLHLDKSESLKAIAGKELKQIIEQTQKYNKQLAADMNSIKPLKILPIFRPEKNA